jgi:multisubunit Na+/H+ antiporter MnhB subunit
MFFIVAVIAGYMLLLVGLAVASPGIGFTGSLLAPCAG